MSRIAISSSLLVLFAFLSCQWADRCFAEFSGLGDEYLAPAIAKEIYVPLSAKSARTWEVIQGTKFKPFPKGTSLGDAIMGLRKAINSKDDSINIYIEPKYLLSIGITMKSPLESVIIGDREFSIYEYLTMILGDIGLACSVQENLIVISPPCDGCPARRAPTFEEAQAWVLLQEEVSLDLPLETSLDVFLSKVREAAALKTRNNYSLCFRVDKFGLQEVNESLESKISISCKNVAICTVLRLALAQVQLVFYVRQDGLVIIDGASHLEKTAIIMDHFDLLMEFLANLDLQATREQPAKIKPLDANKEPSSPAKKEE